MMRTVANVGATHCVASTPQRCFTVRLYAQSHRTFKLEK